MENKTDFMKSHQGDWVGSVGVDKALPGSDRTVFSLSPGMRIYILAREYRHAEHWAHKNHLRREQWKYVSKPNDLMGARGIVIYYSTWYEHDRSNEINDAVIHCINAGRLTRLEGVVDG